MYRLTLEEVKAILSGYRPTAEKTDAPLPTPEPPLDERLYRESQASNAYDYGQLFCTTVRSRIAEDPDTCNTLVEGIDDGVRNVYSEFGIDVGMIPSKEIISANSRAICKDVGSDNCTQWKYDPAFYDGIAQEAVDLYDTPKGRLARVVTQPRATTIFKPFDYDNPLVRGHERKHYHLYWAFENLIFAYGQLFKEAYPGATAKDVSEQIKRWLSDTQRGTLMQLEIKNMERELDCIERDFNLGDACYPVEKRIRSLLDKHISGMRKEIQWRTQKRRNTEAN